MLWLNRLTHHCGKGMSTSLPKMLHLWTTVHCTVASSHFPEMFCASSSTTTQTLTIATLAIGDCLQLEGDQEQGSMMYTLTLVRLTLSMYDVTLEGKITFLGFSTPDIDPQFSASSMAAATWTSYIHTTKDLSTMDVAIRLDACKIMVYL